MTDNSSITLKGKSSRLLGIRGRFEWAQRRRDNAKRLVKI
jgi:hypothetical protein